MSHLLRKTKNQTKMVLIFDRTFLAADVSSSSELERLKQLLSENLNILWFLVPCESHHTEIKIKRAYIDLQNSRKRCQRIKRDLREDEEFTGLEPFVVIDFNRNRDVYDGYDYFISLDTVASEKFHNVIILKVNQLMDEFDMIQREWYNNEQFQFKWCVHRVINNPITSPFSSGNKFRN